MKVLLIEDNPEFATLVQDWLSAASRKDEVALVWAETLEAGLKRLRQPDIDVVLLDLGLPDSDGYSTFEALLHLGPSMRPVIILSGEEDRRLALQMIQCGAQDYLCKTSCNGETLLRALKFALLRHQSQAQTDSSPQAANGLKRMVGVLGSCGGVGTTTVAAVLAADLRHVTGQSVLASDLDIQHGNLSFVLGVEPACTLLDALEGVERLDRSLWDGIVAHRVGELSVLPSPVLMGLEELDLDALTRVFQRGKDYYKWMVLDLGRLNPTAAHFVTRCTDLILVVSMSIHSLHQTRLTLERLRSLGVEQEHIHLVLNHRQRPCNLSSNDLKKLFGVEVFASLPPAEADLHQACLMKRLPAVSSKFRKGLTSVARRLAGLADEESQSANGPIAFVANRFGFRKDQHKDVVDSLVSEPRGK